MEAGQRFEISNNGAVYLAEIAEARGDRVVRCVVDQPDAGAAGAGRGSSPRGGVPAQAGADDHDVVRLGQRNMRHVEMGTIAQRVGDLEGARVTAPQTRLAGRVRTGRRGPRKELRGRRTGDDGKCDSVEKIAAGYPGHGANITAAGAGDGRLEANFVPTAICKVRRTAPTNVRTEARAADFRTSRVARLEMVLDLLATITSRQQPRRSRTRRSSSPPRAPRGRP